MFIYRENSKSGWDCYSHLVLNILGIKLKFKVKPKFQNNKILVVIEHTEKIMTEKQIAKQLKINVIFNGDNNTVSIYNPKNLANSVIQFNGNNSTVIFGGNNSGRYGISLYKDGNKVTIGKDTSCCDIGISAINNEIHIGEDCMISNNVRIWGDGHSVLDAKTKKVINLPTKPIVIGNHVWLGERVTITKNANIPNNCICGIASVVTKSFEEKNCLIAGNPAKIKKRNINWSRSEPVVYKQNVEDKDLIN